MALRKRRGVRSDSFLELLTDYPDDVIRKDAICELARRGNARGLRLARELCGNDIAIAEVAVEVAFSLGSREPFDWFAKYFLIDSFGDTARDTAPLNNRNSLPVLRRCVLKRLVGCNDVRWTDLSCQIALRDPNTAAQIRLQLASEGTRQIRMSLLSPSDGERIKALIRLGELKDVVVLPWIKSRIESDDPISREEYFGFIEAIRQLRSTDGIAVIRRLVKRCAYNGFANVFAQETIELLEEAA